MLRALLYTMRKLNDVLKYAPRGIFKDTGDNIGGWVVGYIPLCGFKAKTLSQTELIEKSDLKNFNQI